MSLPDCVFNLMEKIGTDVTFRKTTESRTPGSLDVNKVFADEVVKAHVRVARDTELSGLSQSVQREVRVAAKAISFSPELGDKVVINGEEFNIIVSDFREHQGEEAFYIVKVRK